MDRHQIHAFPAVFAQQVGKTVQLDGQGSFSMQVWDRDGFPALLQVVSYSPLRINNVGRVTGNPTNNQPGTNGRTPATGSDMSTSDARSTPITESRRAMPPPWTLRIR